MSDNEDSLPSDEYLFEKRSNKASFPKAVTPVNGWAASDFIRIPAIPVGENSQPFGEVKLQVAFPVPGYHTVQFGITEITPEPDASVLNPLVVRPQAEIIWFTKGNGIRRLIDITDGSCISGTGESVSVRIVDNSFFNTTTDADYQYRASISVTPGLRPIQGGVQPPVKNAEVGYYGIDITTAFMAGGTFELVNVGYPILDNRTNIIIPQGCGINSYYFSLAVLDPALIAPVGGELLIIQDAGIAGVAQIISVVNYDGGVNKWVPIVPGARILTFTNNYDVTDPSALLGSILFGVEG